MTGRFAAAIAAENARGRVAVIPDIKCISPKEGDLLRGRDPAAAAKRLVDAGAPLLSVVTERQRFGGSAELLAAIGRAVAVPVLRKDFITRPEQLVETAELGAAAVLLICAITDEENLRSLYDKALALGLEPFVEVHTAQEMALAKRLGARLVGINNRDIVTLEKDDGGPGRTARLAAGAPAGALLVSESGILSAADASLAAAAGADAVLVGTALWQADDMAAMYQTLRVERKTPRPIVKICGLTRAQDVRACIEHGADIVGFVVEYPHPVSWNLDAPTARKLIAAVPKPVQTCAVTGGSVEHVLRVAAETRPDYIQLHAGESLADTATLVGELGKSIRVIKALFPDTPDLEKTAADFCRAGVHAVLFDPRTPNDASRSGAADLSRYRELQRAIDCPVVLAGGIKPENAAAMIRAAQPRMIDLMSGVEASPGIKDHARIAALFAALHD